MGNPERSCFVLLWLTLAACQSQVIPEGPEAVSAPQPAAVAEECTATFVSAGPSSTAAILAAWNDGVDGFAIGRSAAPTAWGQCTRRTCASGGAMAIDPDQHVDVTGFGAAAGDPALAADATGFGQGSGVALFANLSSSIIRGVCSSMCPNGGVGACTAVGELPPNQFIGCFHPGDAIVAYSSIDGGTTWGNNQQQVIVVNEGTGPCDIRAPSQYGISNWNGVDRPHVAWAGGTSFFVEWAGGPDGRLCVRHLIVNATTGEIVAPSSTHEITNHGVGDPLIRDFAGTLYALYPNDFDVPPAGTTATMGYTLAVSGDDGEHWTTNSAFTSSPTFSSIFGFLLLGATGNANGIFGFDIDHNGTLWLAVLDTQLTLAGRVATGTPPGVTPIRILRSDDAGGHWVTDNQPPVTGQVGELNVVVDRLGNVAVSYYQAAPPLGLVIRRMVTIRNASTGVWSLPTPISDPFVPTQPTIQTGGSGRIGEYQGAAAIDPNQFPDANGNTFFEVWTEPDPMALGIYHIAGARLRVAP